MLNQHASLADRPVIQRIGAAPRPPAGDTQQ